MPTPDRVGVELATACDEIPLVEELDLALTLNCGQVFHWQPQGSGFVGTIGEAGVYLEQAGSTLRCTRGLAGLVSHYLALDHPLTKIYASLPGDAPMQAALAMCRGLRIVRQPLWECLATFITSSLKQVAHIAQISLLVRRRFGASAGHGGDVELFAYPTIEAIAALDEAELRQCGLGFRATSLLATARQLADAPDGGEAMLTEWRSLTRAEALERLTGLRGVGTKIANCVLLFAYEHLDAFPIDVWIERALRTAYFNGDPTVPLAELQEFAARYFGPYGGYAQQYLFHQARAMGRKGLLATAEADREEPSTPIRRVRARKSARK